MLTTYCVLVHIVFFRYIFGKIRVILRKDIEELLLDENDTDPEPLSDFKPCTLNLSLPYMALRLCAFVTLKRLTYIILLSIL